MIVVSNSKLLIILISCWFSDSESYLTWTTESKLVFHSCGANRSLMKSIRTIYIYIPMLQWHTSDLSPHKHRSPIWSCFDSKVLKQSGFCGLQGVTRSVNGGSCSSFAPVQCECPCFSASILLIQGVMSSSLVCIKWHLQFLKKSLCMSENFLEE